MDRKMQEYIFHSKQIVGLDIVTQTILVNLADTHCSSLFCYLSPSGGQKKHRIHLRV